MKKIRLLYHFDIVSPYSYLGFAQLFRKYQNQWSNHVVIDYVPIFLGGVMKESGNIPPGSNPFKAAWLGMDLKRSAHLLGIDFQMASVFPINTINIMRLLCVIKEHESAETYQQSIEALFRAYWAMDKNLGKVEDEELQSILQLDNLTLHLERARDAKTKEQLLTNTTQLVSRYGAFGAPWIVVQMPDGREECFFGSDRFEHIISCFGSNDIKYEPLTVRSCKL